MIAKLMNLMSFLPNWNSLDSVRRVHSDLEFAAIVFFAMLVLFDVLAHLAVDKKRETLLERIGLWFFAIAVIAELVAYPYGQRNDTLSADIIGSLDKKASDAATKAGNAVTDAAQAESLAQGASEEAGWARSLAEKAEGAVADRSLTDKQVKDVSGKLSGFGGQPYTVVAYWQSKESVGLANRIHSALENAKWAYSDEGSKAMMLGGVIGVVVLTNSEADERTKQAASALINSLSAIGLKASPLQEPPNVPKNNMIWVRIGGKL
jgi:hypothetical protein